MKRKPVRKFSCLGLLVIILACVGLVLIASSISSLSAPGVPHTATPKKGLSTILKVSPIGTEPAVPVIIETTAAPVRSAPIALPTATVAIGANCDPSYPDVCIAPRPPDLSCKDVPYKGFRVLPPDPHGFDGNNDGIGCEG